MTPFPQKKKFKFFLLTILHSLIRFGDNNKSLLKDT
jgi:hypothetical protein